MYTTFSFIQCLTLLLGSCCLDPNTQKVEKNAVYYDETQHTNCKGKPPFQTTKQHLNNSQAVKDEI